MKKLKLALLSTALLVGVNHIAYATYSQTELETLRELSESRDTKALVRFINANPQLMQGNDPLAMALREFAQARQGTMGRIFGPRAPSLTNVPDLPSSVSSSSQVSFGSVSDFGS